jgi:predicted deacylase
VIHRKIGKVVAIIAWLTTGSWVWATEVVEDSAGSSVYEAPTAGSELDETAWSDEAPALDEPESAITDVEAEPPPAAREPGANVGGQPLVLLGTEVPPATSTRLAWTPNQSFEGIFSATPVLVVNGVDAGPTLCLTAAVHGDELNGIETVRRVMYGLDPEDLSGAVIGVPIVNLQGFHRGSRYLVDRRDLNRYFPGDPRGSSASRIAHSFFREVVEHCDAVVDLHTGSFYRTNLPQLRADLTRPGVMELTKGFGSTVVLHDEPAEGTLRYAAVAAGIPAVTLEAGAPMLLHAESVEESYEGIQSLLHHLGMVGKFSLWGEPEPVYYNSTWQRAPVGGIVFSTVKLGEQVKVGDLLGTVTNPITNVRTEIRSAYDGRILGMALNQVVQPGYATHHIGIAAPPAETQPVESEDIALDTLVEDETDPLSE